MLILVINTNFYHNTSRSDEKNQLLKNIEIRGRSNFDVDGFCTHLNYKLDFLFDENSWSRNELCSRLITAFGEE